MTKEKIFSKAKFFILVIGCIYTIITILAVISAVGDMQKNSTVSIGISNVFSLIWFHLLVVIFMLATYFLYSKKRKIALALELLTGTILVINVIINIIIVGATSAIVVLNFVIPASLLIHAFLTFSKLHILSKDEKIKRLIKM